MKRHNADNCIHKIPGYNSYFPTVKEIKIIVIIKFVRENLNIEMYE